MRSALLGMLAALLTLAVAPPAAAQTINLNSIFDAAKGIAKSREVAQMSEADEIDIGKQVAANTLGTYRIVKDEKLQRYLNQVGLWVAMQSDRPELPWRFAAVESDQINAFAVPGGAVLVTRGMLKLLANEAELACVFGHEIGHVVYKHHLALMQKDLLLQSGSKLVTENIQNAGIGGEAKRFLVSEGAELYARSLDRDSERDADNYGVLMAARAGYDPDACLMLMRRMAGMKSSADTLASLYKTHPKATDRVVDIEKALGDLDGAVPGTGERPALGYRE